MVLPEVTVRSLLSALQELLMCVRTIRPWVLVSFVIEASNRSLQGEHRPDVIGPLSGVDQYQTGALSLGSKRNA